MAQFIAYNPEIEIASDFIVSVINCMTRGKEFRASVFAKHGLPAENGKWYNQQRYLNALKEISETIGDMNILLMGIAAVESAEHPPMSGLEECLSLMNIVHHMNHRFRGEMMYNPQTHELVAGNGSAILTDFDANARKAVMELSSPYPYKFEEGLLTAFVRKFYPNNIATIIIKEDVTKEQKTKGADCSTVLISW